MILEVFSNVNDSVILTGPAGSRTWAWLLLSPAVSTEHTSQQRAQGSPCARSCGALPSHPADSAAAQMCNCRYSPLRVTLTFFPSLSSLSLPRCSPPLPRPSPVPEHSDQRAALSITEGSRVGPHTWLLKGRSRRS